MKKVCTGLFLVLIFSACNNSSEVKVSFDSVGKKFDSSAEKIWKSTKEKGKELKEKIEDKLQKKDTVVHTDTLH